MKSTEKWNVPRLASQMVQARNKQINCPNIETNTLYQRRKIERGIQTRHRSKLRCTSDGHCFDQFCSQLRFLNFLIIGDRRRRSTRKATKSHLKRGEKCCFKARFFSIKMEKNVVSQTGFFSTKNGEKSGT